MSHILPAARITVKSSDAQLRQFIGEMPFLAAIGLLFPVHFCKLRIAVAHILRFRKSGEKRAKIALDTKGIFPERRGLCTCRCYACGKKKKDQQVAHSMVSNIMNLLPIRSVTGDLLHACR